MHLGHTFPDGCLHIRLRWGAGQGLQPLEVGTPAHALPQLVTGRCHEQLRITGPIWGMGGMSRHCQSPPYVKLDADCHGFLFDAHAPSNLSSKHPFKGLMPR